MPGVNHACSLVQKCYSWHFFHFSFFSLFSFLESQLCTSRGIQCYSSGLPLRFPFLWCISKSHVMLFIEYQRLCEVKQVTRYHCCLIEGTTSMFGQHFSQCWQLVYFLSYLKKKPHTQTCLCWITVYKWMQKSKQWMHLKQQTVYICCKQMTVVRHCLFLYFGWNGMKHFKCGRTQIFHHTHAHTGGGEMTPLTLVSQPATLNNPVRMYSLAIRRF